MPENTETPPLSSDSDLHDIAIIDLREESITAVVQASVKQTLEMGGDRFDAHFVHISHDTVLLTLGAMEDKGRILASRREPKCLQVSLDQSPRDSGLRLDLASDDKVAALRETLFDNSSHSNMSPGQAPSDLDALSGALLLLRSNIVGTGKAVLSTPMSADDWANRSEGLFRAAHLRHQGYTSF